MPAAKTAVLLLLPLFGFGLPPHSTTYDVAADFSLEHNPADCWQYGYSESASLDPGRFRIDKNVQKVGAIGFWHPLENRGPGPGYYPYVAFNTTGASQLGSQNGWAVRSNEVAMEASNSGQYSLIRFTAPATGKYNLEARFAGIHFGLSTTDVHILHNAESLFEADIEGYGGDPALHQIQGLHPTAAFTGVIRLVAGDTLTFAVGYGRNKTHYSDTTGLSAKITRIGS